MSGGGCGTPKGPQEKQIAGDPHAKQLVLCKEEASAVIPMF